jgi:Family of unknown function (DUF6092)
MQQSPRDGLPTKDALALLAYLVTSADLCTHEPLHYGMFRLTDGAGRLAGGLAASGAAAERPWLADLHRSIEEHKELLMWDLPAFERFLHETAATVAANLKREADDGQG